MIAWAFNSEISTFHFRTRSNQTWKKQIGSISTPDWPTSQRKNRRDLLRGKQIKISSSEESHVHPFAQWIGE